MEKTMQPQKGSRDRATARVDNELGMNVPPSALSEPVRVGLIGAGRIGTWFTSFRFIHLNEKQQTDQP
jgi:hypothetical protein